MIFSLLESARAALASILAHGFRSFLTTLGIVIGVASVIAVVSITEGLSASIGQQIQSLGTNTLTVRAYTPIEDRMKGVRSRVTIDDLKLIQDRVDGISSITPVLVANRASQVRSGSNSFYSQILGTTHNYQDIAQYYTHSGRFLAKSDELTRRRVCVIGESVRNNLSLPKNPVGEYIEINREWFKVIGLLETKGEFLNFDQDDIVLMPYTTMNSLQGHKKRINIEIQLNVKDPETMEATIERISLLMRKAHKLKPGSSDDFKVQTSEQLTETFDQIISTVTVVVGGIVSISLLVGGIGIMNIMLVSVTERTREIGICKAIGAKRHHILGQFLLEALLLSLLGGVIGMILGYGLGAGISAAIPGFPPATIPLWAAAMALGFSGLVGIIFGILPAAKAANLNPIDALRYE